MLHALALMVVEGYDKILDRGLQVAKALGLPVTSWRTGDPTNSYYQYLARALVPLELSIVEYAKAAFLSTCPPEWLPTKAAEDFGVDVEDAAPATPTVTLRNEGGGFYPIDVRDLTVKCSATGKTYHNTDTDESRGASLDPGATVTFALEADEAGAASSVGENEIDALVTGMLGVVVVSSTASYGRDQLEPAAVVDLCRTSMGPLSPAGPSDAFRHVATQYKYTGTHEVTKAWSTNDSTTGDVTVYVAGTGGAVSSAGELAVLDAVRRYCAGLCTTPTVASASELPVVVQATVEGTLPTGYAAKVAAELAKYFAALDIVQPVMRSALIAQIHAAVPEITRVTLVAPGADVIPGEGQIAVLSSASILAA